MTVIEDARTVAWTAAEVEDLVIELLGDFLKEDPEQLRKKLVDKGAGMPVDSLDLFDVLQDLRKRTGLRIPVRKLRRQTMRSVKLFAKFVEQEARL
jgi:acyl carrier protein